MRIYPMKDNLLIEDEVFKLTDALEYSAKHTVIIDGCRFYGHGGSFSLTLWNKYTEAVISNNHFMGEVISCTPLLNIKYRYMWVNKRNKKHTKKGSK